MSRKWRNMMFFFMTMAAIAFVAVVLLLCFVQARVLANPPRSTASGTPSDFGIETWQDVTFMTSDDLELSGWYIPPAEDANGASVLFVHGHAGHRGEFRFEAELLAEFGYGMLLFDLRNHGRSAEAGTTMGDHEVRDVLAAFDFLTAQPAVDPERIALFGHSMGAGTTIQSAVQLPDIQAVIVSAPFTSVIDGTSAGVRIRAGLPPWPLADIILTMANIMSGGNLYSVRPIDNIAQIAPRPLLIVHGTDDQVVPLEQGQALYETAGEPKSLYIVDGAGHPDRFRMNTDNYSQRITNFLLANLPPN